MIKLCGENEIELLTQEFITFKVTDVSYELLYFLFYRIQLRVI